jgi:hypothetical protein
MVPDGYLRRFNGARPKKSHEKRKGDMMGIGRDGLFLDVSRYGMEGNHLNSKEINLILYRGFGK